MRINGNVGPFGLLLVTDSSMQAANGYQIMFYGDGNYFVRKVHGWNYSTIDRRWFRLDQDLDGQSGHPDRAGHLEYLQARQDRRRLQDIRQ